MSNHVHKICQECGALIKGRADKKFCDDHCRANYNNRINSSETHYMRSVIHVLRRNRRILKELNHTGKTRVHCNKLHHRGFDFTYFTNIDETGSEGRYYYCFDQGYILLKDGDLLLVTKPPH
jgi:hypothetical protein